jgi:hypothetical protein
VERGMKLKNIFKKKYVYRSAKDGRFVGRVYALLHPSTTIREKIG